MLIKAASLSVVFLRDLSVWRHGRLKPYISITSFRWTNISYSFLYSSCSLEFSSLEVKYDIFRYGDEGTWQKPLAILTTKDRWSEHLKYVTDFLQWEEASSSKSIITHTHTHTHTHTCNTYFYIVISVC